MKFSIEALYGWYRNIIRNPKYRWWVIGASLLYLVSPFDISPDIFPIVGWIDDGVIATLLVAELSQVLLDRLKAGKDTSTTQTPSPANEATSTNPSVTTNTVNVDAVKVADR
jgi:uncharacterized membrane protein YkvA (DUF1232 family)